MKKTVTNSKHLISFSENIEFFSDVAVLTSKCLDCSCRNISHICSGWTWLMPSTKVWSVSSFPTLWVWISTLSSHLNILFVYLFVVSSVFILVSYQKKKTTTTIPPPGLLWLRRRSVYLGNSHHYHCLAHHSGAFGRRDQNLGKIRVFKFTDDSIRIKLESSSCFHVSIIVTFERITLFIPAN